MSRIEEQRVSEVASEGGSRPKAVREVGRLGGGGLRIYKPGQGYWTRMGTAIGGGVLIAAGVYFLFGQLDLDPAWRYTLAVRYGVSVLFLVGMSILLYWVVGLNRKANDFFIATEGEMKKVSWSSTKDIIRSTKVVIFMTLLLGLILFLADVLFMLFFSQIKVLQAGPRLETLFGSGS